MQEGRDFALRTSETRVRWVARRLTDSRINCRARQPDPARRTPELPRGR